MSFKNPTDYLELVTGMTLPGNAQAQARAGVANAIGKQTGLQTGNSTMTTSAANSNDGNTKYTPGRTTESPAIESKASQPKSTTTTYTVNANNKPYANQLNELYDRVMNRKPFQYDLNGDLLYQQMADQYTMLGKQAMMDTMGQAAALTGGYGNSYAQSVGNQAYQQYLSGLNDQIPALYQQAYNVYQGDTDRLLQQYELAAAHPGMLEAISPKTYTMTQGSAETSDDNSAYLQMLQNMMSSNAQTSAGTAPTFTLEDYLALVAKYGG